MNMERRTAIGAAIGAMATAGRARAATPSVVTFVPQTDVAGLDPIWSTQTAA